MDLIFIIYVMAVLLFSVCAHEYAHGWIAYKLGDPTPKISGRLTLNPAAHIDPFGSIILPAFFIITSLMAAGTPFIFAYAKPVPINPYNLINPKKDMLWIGLSGPLTNLLIAIILSIIMRFSPEYTITKYIYFAAMLNVFLCVLNLMPIPPLDGSRVLTAVLPHSMAAKYLKIEPYGFFLIIFLFFTGILQRVIFPFIMLISALIGIQ